MGSAAADFSDNATLITPHPYMSAWPSWPLLVRPVWLLFEKVGDDRYWAVLSLGNPVILWSAIPAVLVCLRDWIVERRRDAFLIGASYAALYLAWMVLPRAIGFSFYYLPARRNGREPCAGLLLLPQGNQTLAVGAVDVSGGGAGRLRAVPAAGGVHRDVAGRL